MITNGTTRTAFDPAHVLPNGRTVVANTVACSIFDATTYILGGVNVGTTQYIDAFQRADFWRQAFSQLNRQISPDSLLIFLTYVTQGRGGGGRCIGGYHSVTGTPSYVHFTYIDYVGDFAQDISALSQEGGDWAEDALVNYSGGSPVACGSLEVGAPEEIFTHSWKTWYSCRISAHPPRGQ